MIIKMWLGSDKSDMYDQAIEQGCDESVAEKLIYALYEVCFTLNVNEKDGTYKIIDVKEKGF